MLRLLLGIIEIIFTIVERVISQITGLLTRGRVSLHSNYDYRNWLRRDLKDCDRILELGCGSNSPILQIGYGKKTDAIDIWKPYVDAHNFAGHYRSCVHADILKVMLNNPIYDAVVICDTLEHLDKDMVFGTGLFKKMESCAKKKVIIFTPNGKLDNDMTDSNPYQEHLSSWEPKDYTSRGYKVFGATGYRGILGNNGYPKYHPYSIFEIIAMLTMPFIFNKPDRALHSYAIKHLNGANSGNG